jgi:hypothetical protein
MQRKLKKICAEENLGSRFVFLVTEEEAFAIILLLPAQNGKGCFFVSAFALHC